MSKYEVERKANVYKQIRLDMKTLRHYAGSNLQHRFHIWGWGKGKHPVLSGFLLFFILLGYNRFTAYTNNVIRCTVCVCVVVVHASVLVFISGWVGE